ncbi:MAG: HAMP domain-containing sensor histidine kinase, partial [Pseudomonadota bacterium]
SSERHPPDRIVEDCLPLVKHLLAKSDIEVLQSHTATRQIQMNRTELQQVLVNLMVNAIHAMPDGGTLKLVTSDGDGTPPGVTLSVADTGMGMAPDVLARIFDPFYTTKRREGTGLGLSISQTLISRQGGVIDVSSDLGEGTTFTIWLPEAS